MRDANFSLIFEGPAVDSGAIDVQDLAPSLLALEHLIQVANAELNGNSAQVAVKVKTTRSGSFEVDMAVVQSLVEQTATLLDALSGHKEGIAAASTLADVILKVGGAAMGAVVTTGGGLFAFLKWLSERRPEKIGPVGGDVHVHIGDTVFVTNRQTIVLAENREVREQARKLVGTLENRGIERLSAQRSGAKRLTIEKSEVAYFDLPDGAEETLEDSERVMWLQIDSLSFKEGNKWRMTDGGEPFYAVLEDVDFLSRIAKGEVAFSKADDLHCRVRETQTRTASGQLRKERTITRVIEHRPGAKQLRLL
jgi:hypothetical protein